MNEQDLKALYARWRATAGARSEAPAPDAIARLSLEPEGEADDAALLELSRSPESLAAFRVARELAPNSAGLARALGTGGTRLAVVSASRTRPAVWAAAAAVALMVLVVDGVERKRERERGAAVAAHDVIATGSFEGDAPAAQRPDTLFRSDFDG